jgi:hypothetical protein
MKHAIIRLLMSPLAPALPFLVATTLGRAQIVTTEPHAKYLSAGHGEKPFVATRHTIPLKEIQSSVPRDTIPALSNPKFISAGQVRGLLKKSDRVLGVYLNGEAKAYPVRILNWHELVNDTLGGRPILVSW